MVCLRQGLLGFGQAAAQCLALGRGFQQHAMAFALVQAFAVVLGGGAQAGALQVLMP
jgi:hypothetical protein